DNQENVPRWFNEHQENVLRWLNEHQENVLRWLNEHQINHLNVSGPRESNADGIYNKAYDFIFGLLVLLSEKFSLKRNYEYGRCEFCNRYNTSEVWCQTCDTQKLAQ
ncbi:10111_t:CDS:1, partial [Ambispora leptoticha]